MNKPVRVLLCDDQAIIRARVREALARKPEVEVVGEAAGGLAGVKMARELAPDLILMDVSMPDLDGVEATRQVIATAPLVRVLAFSADARQQTVAAMVLAGAAGFLLKNSDPDEWVRGILSVMAGRFYMSASIRGASAAKADGPSPSHNPPDWLRKFMDMPKRPRPANDVPWTAAYVPERNMVLATITGAITDEDARAQSEFAIRLLNETKATRVLIDCCEAISEMSYAVLYWMPKFYSLLGAPISTRIAVVLPRVPHRLESFQFYALACRNSGYNVRLFESRQTAEEWLEKSGSA